MSDNHLRSASRDQERRAWDGSGLRSCSDCWRSTSWLVFRGAKFGLVWSGERECGFERVEMGGIRAAMLNLGLGLAGSMMRERNGVRG